MGTLYECEIHRALLSKRETHEKESTTSYLMQVQDCEFEIAESVYNWVSEGDELVVKFWPRSEQVVEVWK